MNNAIVEGRRRGRPPRSEDRDIRTKIIDVARRRFVQHGYEATTIAGIAAEVRISGNTIYHYFKSKRGLWLVVYQETYSKVWGALEAESSSLGVHDAFISMIHRARDFRHTNGEQSFSDFLYRATSDMLSNDDLAEVREDLIARRGIYFQALAERGKSNGELRGLSDVPTAAAVLKILMLGVLHEAHMAQAVTDDVINAIEQTLEILSSPVSVVS